MSASSSPTSSIDVALTPRSASHPPTKSSSPPSVDVDRYNEHDLRKSLINLWKAIIEFNKDRRLSASKRDVIVLIKQIKTKFPFLDVDPQSPIVVYYPDTIEKTIKQVEYNILYNLVKSTWPAALNRERSLRDKDGDFYIPFISILIENRTLEKLTEYAERNRPLFIYLITLLPTVFSQTTINQCQCTTVEELLSETPMPIQQINTENCGRSGYEFLLLIHSIIIDSPPFLESMRNILSYEDPNVLGVGSDPVSIEVRSRLCAAAKDIVKSIYLAPTDPLDGFTAFDSTIFVNSRLIKFNVLRSQAIPFFESAEWTKLLIIVLHECAHALRRKFLPNADSLFSSRTSPRPSNAHCNEKEKATSSVADV